jgi:hypothetical protein
LANDCYDDSILYSTVLNTAHPIRLETKVMSAYETQLCPNHAQITADADLRFRLGIALAARRRAAWRVVRVGAQDGVVRLEGIVPTYYDRQLILAIAQHVAGVLRVEDELTIDHPEVRVQEVIERPASSASDQAGSQSETSSAPQGGPAPNAFHHLPVLSESLEDILAKRTQSAKAAG